MKRVLFSAAALASAAIGACALLPYKVSLYLAAIFFAAAVSVCIFAGKYKWRLSVIICLAVTAILLSRFYITTVNGPQNAEILAGKSAEATGIVTGEPDYKNGKYIYRITTDSVSFFGAPQRLNLKLFLDRQLFEAYDRFEGELRFYSIASEYIISGYADNIYLNAYPVSISKTGSEKEPFLRLACEIRQEVRKCITKNLSPEVSGILIGLITDGSDFLDEETYSAFLKCGLSHTVTVSGMHMVIVSNAAMLLLGFIGVEKRLSFLLSLPLLLIYTAVSGFSPSAIRSVIMIIAVFLGGALYRRNDGLNTLGITVIAMLAVSPFLVYDISFLLSASAMAGIFLSVPACKRMLSKIKSTGQKGSFSKYVLSLTASTLSANIATFPVVLLLFGSVSTVSVIANLLLSFVIEIVLILGILTVALAVIFGENIIIESGFRVIEVLLFYVRSTAMAIADIPNSHIMLDVPRISLYCAVAFAVFAIILLMREAQMKRVHKAVGCALLFVITAVISANVF